MRPKHSLPLPAADRVAPLSPTAEYALRAMVYLALNPNEGVRSSDLASAINVPSHYLSKVLRKLVEAGLLASQKGHGGGFTLARDPDGIPFSDILAAVGEEPSGERCAFGWGRCDARNPCPLHPAWSKLNAAMLAWAQSTTLADVVMTAASQRPASAFK